MSSGHIKGAAVRQALLWLERELGEARVHEILDTLDAPEELMSRHLPAFGVTSSTWYPVPLMHRLCDAIVQGRTRGEARALAEAGAEQALTATFGTVQRVLFQRIASPRLHRMLAQRLWSLNFDEGTVMVDLPEPGLSLVTYRDWSGHHTFICDMCTASDLIIYRAMGLGEVEVAQLTCIDDGDPDCTHRVTWRVS